MKCIHCGGEMKPGTIPFRNFRVNHAKDVTGLRNLLCGLQKYTSPKTFVRPCPAINIHIYGTENG